MTKMIFVNLPVVDLRKSMAFYAALGFTNNPHFTDATAACIQEMVEGHRAIPQPVLNQVAACLFGSGSARDLTHAKATVSLGLNHAAH